jgi:hypothetical protein
MIVNTFSNIAGTLVQNIVTVSDRDDCAKGLYNSGYQECPNETMVSFYTSGGFCVPEGVTRVSYIMIGGGGGGGAGANEYGGGGGGAGQIVQGHFVVTGGARVDVATGAGGYGASTQYFGGYRCPDCPPDPYYFPNEAQVNGGYSYGSLSRGRGGVDTVITVTCRFTGGYIIRARGGCGGGSAYGGEYCSYSRTYLGTKVYKGARGGNGGHSWLPVYQINYPSNRTIYKLSPRNSYFNAGGYPGKFVPITDPGVQNWIACRGRQPIDTSQLGSSSTGYITQCVFKVCPVVQHFRPLGVYKAEGNNYSSGGNNTRYKSGGCSYSWIAQNGTVSSNSLWRPYNHNPWNQLPCGSSPKLETYGSYGSYRACNFGGGGASGFSHGGLGETYTVGTSSVTTRYMANYICANANPATASGTGVRKVVNGFGTTCRHALCNTVWYAYRYASGGGNTTEPPAGVNNPGYVYAAGGAGIPSFNKTITNAPICVKTCTKFKYPYIWYCLYDPNCCGIRNSGYNGIGFKQCGTKTYQNIYSLNGWGQGGIGGVCTTITPSRLAPFNQQQYPGPGSGGAGGRFTPQRATWLGNSQYSVTAGYGFSGSSGQSGAAIFHYQIRLNTSMIREALEGGANRCDFPCLPDRPPTATKIATYTCPNMIACPPRVIKGVSMAAPKTPARVLAYGNVIYCVPTPNPNYRPELGTSYDNQPTYYPTFFRASDCTKPIGMNQFFGKCFVRRYLNLPVNSPPPPKVTTTPFPKTTPVYATVTYYFWGGGGGGSNRYNLKAFNFCGLGGAGGGGGGVITTGVVGLLANRCFTKYEITVGAGGGGTYYGGTGAGGDTTSIKCLSCGPNGYRGASYGARVSGFTSATGGYGGSGKDGGLSRFCGGTGYRCGTLPNYGGGGGGGGSGTRGSCGGAGGCFLRGGDGGLGIRLQYVHLTNRNAGIQNYYIGGGGGGGGGYLGGTGASRVAGGIGFGGGNLCATYGRGSGGGFVPGQVIRPQDGGPNSGFGGGGSGTEVWLCYVYVYVPPPPPPPKGLLEIIGGIAGFFIPGGSFLTAAIGSAIGSFISGLAVQTNGYSYIDPRYALTGANSSGGNGGGGGAIISYNATAGELFNVTGNAQTYKSGNNIYHVFWGSGNLIGKG